jgi:integrase
LTKALAAHPDRQVSDIIRLLLLTGARKGEVMSAEWDAIDLTKGIWTKPASTTKQKLDHIVPLSAPALQLLNDIRARGVVGKFVFPSKSESGCRAVVDKAWKALCRDAEITGLRIHDLRHSFASQLASSGASLPLIGALLGHSQPSTTARYAHLFQDPQRAAVEGVGAIVVAAGRPTKKQGG